VVVAEGIFSLSLAQEQEVQALVAQALELPSVVQEPMVLAPLCLGKDTKQEVHTQV